MSSDLSLRELFWRDVAVAAGHRDLDPRAIHDAVQDMMRNYHLDEVPGFESASAYEHDVPDINSFSEHSAFAPVFPRSVCNLLPSWGCFSAARPIFVGPRRMLRRRRTCPEQRHPDHFPGGGNPGIQANTEPVQPANPPPPPVDTNAAPPWSWYPPFHLPPWPPNHYVWVLPTGHLAWCPHPQPNPFVSQPLGPWSAITLTGGHPLPGTMPQWTPGTWPPLDWSHDVPIRLSPYIIPNPNNAHLPLIDWNVAQHPSTAKRLTPNHVVVDMSSIWAQPVTHTGARSLVVTCDVGHLSTLWGPIVVGRADGGGDGGGPATLRDLFDAIHAHFQVPLTYPEVRYVCGLHPSNYRRLTDAYYERCRASPGLPGWEAKRGYKRADVLGDRRYWWGVWVSTRDGCWWLNLGLVNPAHRAPPGRM